MSRHFTLTTLFSFFAAFASFAQAWMPLGPSETSGTSISETAAFVHYSAVASDGTVYMSYIDDRTGPNNLNDFKVHVRKFDGNVWEDLGAISPAIPYNDFFPVTCDGKDVYAAYSEPMGTPDAGKLTVRKYEPSSAKWLEVGNTAFSAGAARGTGITAADKKLYVAYADESLGNRVVVKVFELSSPATGWQTLGPAGFSDGPTGIFINEGINIAVIKNKVYVAYNDQSLNNNSGGLVVKHFDGTAWKDAGTTAIVSNASAGYTPKMVFNKDGKLYISFVSPGLGVFVSVLSGTDWTAVGTQPVSLSGFMAASISAVENDIYLAYADGAGGGKSQVWMKKFVAGGSAWQDLSSSAATAAQEDVNHVLLHTTQINKLVLTYRVVNNTLYAKSMTTGTVAPVVYKYFTARPVQDKALLEWATLSEINNKEFIVEHSRDGKQFRAITEVAAGEHVYKYLTCSLAPGVHYFRLVQVDKDGTSAYSKTLTLTIAGEGKLSLKVYPNPVKDRLSISGDLFAAGELCIVNSQGAVVRRIKVSGMGLSIDVSTLPPGQYFIMTAHKDKPQTLSFVR